ncbi:MAG: DUF1674 domain-containing protein [Proteobacteria bacterium]|nr:DUF1674 domain-containing protein [Pseudomonadota bacterium]
MIGHADPSPRPEDVAETPQVPAPEPPSDEASEQEFGGREGPEPTRYGDWEKNGRCIDF